jgi:O-antigen ligase
MMDLDKHLPVLFSKKEILPLSGFCSLCLTLFLMPFPRSWSLYPLGAFLFFGLIMWLTDARFIYDHFKNKFLYLLPLILYFILYFIYFIINGKWTFLEDKLMFLLIPLLGFPIIISEFLKRNFRTLLVSFISGIIIICIYQLIRATYESLSLSEGIIKFDPLVNPGISRYNWIQLSSFEHPTYLAIKILWAITLLLMAAGYVRLSKIASIFIIIFLTVFTYMLSSRSGIIILAFIFIYFIYTRLKNSKYRIFIVLLIPFILYSSVKLTTVSQRMNNQLKVIIGNFSTDKIDWKNIDPRMRVWHSSLVLIKEKPLFGVGPDTKSKLTEVYKSEGFTAEAFFRLNAHNQFLESQLTFGILGTVVLFWMLITPLIWRRKAWNPSLICPFLIIVTVTMIFESILVRQWGIMFFVLFYCILTIPDKVPPN